MMMCALHYIFKQISILVHIFAYLSDITLQVRCRRIKCCGKSIIISHGTAVLLYVCSAIFLIEVLCLDNPMEICITVYSLSVHCGVLHK